MKIGILSFEHMHAYSYAQCLMSDAKNKLTAVFDDRESMRKEIKKNFPGVVVYDDYKKLLKEDDCEGVIVASANARHVLHAVAAAKSGRHILCEKPIATAVPDAKKIIAECKKSGVVLMTAFPVRFAPSIKRAKDIIDSGRLGEILAVKSTNHGSMPGGWFIDKKLSGGGAIMDHTVHVADLLRYLLNAEFKTVYAESASKLHNIKVDDCGLLLFEMTNGAFCSLDASWSRHPSYKIWGDVTLEIKGTKGNLSVDCFPTTINIYQNKTMKHGSMSTGDNYDRIMIDEFVTAVEENREPFVTGEDGMRAVELALAAYKAIRDKKCASLPI